MGCDRGSCDPRYQRSLEVRGAQNVAKIAKNFNWGRFSPILCTPVDGGFFAVIDGQHRTHAARACGIKNVPAMIVEMTDQEAAEAFVWVNASITAVTPVQIYKSSLAAELPWAIECRDAVAEADCKLMTVNYSGAAKKVGQVFCVSVVRKLVENGDKAVMIKVLAALRQLEFVNPYYFSAAILKPMFNLFKEIRKVETPDIVDFLKHNELEDIERGVHKLREQPAYFREQYHKLLQACIKAKWNEWKREQHKAKVK